MKKRGWEFWLALSTLVLSGLAASAVLYARLCVVEHRVKGVEVKVDGIITRMDARAGE